MDVQARKREDALTEDVAKKIWLALFDGGARGTTFARERDNFLWMQTTEFVREYRFQGNLGFGGKFWRNSDKWYVTCYPEDEDEKRLKIIAETNRLLANVKAETERP